MVTWELKSRPLRIVYMYTERSYSEQVGLNIIAVERFSIVYNHKPKE